MTLAGPRDRNAITDPRRTTALEHQQTALELRSQYKSFRTIAEHLGVSHETARRYVLQAIELAKERIANAGDELRAEEMARMDQMSVVYGERALEGDIKAAEMWLKLRARWAALGGVDKQLPRPKDAEIEVTMVGWTPPPTATEAEAEALRSVVRKISAAKGAPVEVTDEAGRGVDAEIVDDSGDPETE